MKEGSVSNKKLVDGIYKLLKINNWSLVPFKIRMPYQTILFSAPFAILFPRPFFVPGPTGQAHIDTHVLYQWSLHLKSVLGFSLIKLIDFLFLVDFRYAGVWWLNQGITERKYFSWCSSFLFCMKIIWRQPIPRPRSFLFQCPIIRLLVTL